jgi:hypothetical protein
MPASFSSDRSYVFDVEPGEFWAAISRTDDFPRWWSWLRRLDAGGLEEGTQARCEVDPPLPYNLRFTITLDRIVPERLVEATVAGDIAGPARLEVEPHRDGSQIRLTWDLVPGTPFLRGLSRVARPVMVWGHDRVIDLGVRQFRQRALADGDGR